MIDRNELTEIIEILDDLQQDELDGKSPCERAGMILESIDKDGDGYITFEEFQSAAKNLFDHSSDNED